MIVIHAVWSSASQLCVWAEDSERPGRARRRPGRRPSSPRPRQHPFACSTTELAAALFSLAGRSGSAGPADRRLSLQLPSAGDGPCASPGLLRSAEGAPVGPADRLDAWVVPVVAILPVEALDLLLAVPPVCPPGLAVGDSLRFLVEAGKLALELVARGRVLPGIARDGDGWVARWRPVTDDPCDEERVRMLVRSAPPLLRAELSASDDGNAPVAVIGDLLAAIVDVSARKFAAGSIQAGRTRRRPVGAVDAWLAALLRPDPAVAGDVSELAALAEALEEWRAFGLEDSAQRSFRTCFRLSPPELWEAPGAGLADGAVEAGVVDRAAGADGVGTSSWRVEILVQAKDDPSILVAAKDVWSSNGAGLAVFGRRFANPQERLLGGLGHAVRLWPELEPALRQATPTGVELDDEAAYRFLREVAPALEEGGFGVLAPAWWDERVRVKLKASPTDEAEKDGPALLGIDGLCAYEWRVAVGDATLSLAELHALAALKLPLIRVRGRWVALRPEDVDAALKFFEGRAERGEVAVAELLRAELTAGAADAGLPHAEIEAEGWLNELLSGETDRRLELLAPPTGLAGTLRPYQERGLAWLFFLSRLGLGACLADDMGLGKTIQLLALLLAEREHNFDDATAAGSDEAGRRPDGKVKRRRRKRMAPTLLVCPMSVVGNWEREAERFAPGLSVHVHHGRDRLTGKEFGRAARASDLVVTTYALATRDGEALGAVKWDRIALDEAQNIKTAGAKQTRAIRALGARHRVALTGTPVENRLSELHSIMDFLNPGLLGSAASFRSHFATPIERYRDAAATATLRRATGPFILRRLKTDKTIIDDLPEKIEMKIDCHLTREQATLYQAVVDEMLEKLEEAEGIERRGIVLAALMKLKQVCNHPAHLLKDRSHLADRSGKLIRVEEILAEAVAEGDKALCFTQFAEFGHMLRGYLQERLGQEALFLHGGTPRTARDELVARFQAPGGPRLLVLSLKAGGTGLNLTAANHVVHFDRWWNPAVEDQATDRAFRIGQRKNVQVRKMICVGTLEERIDRMIEDKKDLADRIVGTGEAWLTELDTSQLRELVGLSSDAVADPEAAA